MTRKYCIIFFYRLEEVSFVLTEAGGLGLSHIIITLILKNHTVNLNLKKKKEE